MPVLIDGTPVQVAIPARRPLQVALPPALPRRVGVVRGAAGPEGPPGMGVSDAFEHQQATPSASWVIPVPESFGRRPTVVLYDPDGELIDADVTASSTTVSIQFPTPTTGSAVLT